MVLSKVKREEQSLPHPTCRSQETQAVFPLRHCSCQKNLEEGAGHGRANFSVLLDAAIPWCFENPCQPGFKHQDESLHSLAGCF